jgi:nicotinamide-nucleotide amidase
LPAVLGFTDTSAMNDQIERLSDDLGRRLKAVGWMLATAESCTGGWIAKAVTDIPGSSGWLDRGFVSYSNAAKQDMLGVRPRALAEHGAVSEVVAREMALGALVHSNAQVAVAVSGVAGPGGGSEAKPVGTVCAAIACRDRSDVMTWTCHFDGDRDAVRRQTVIFALERLIETVADGC